MPTGRGDDEAGEATISNSTNKRGADSFEELTTNFSRIKRSKVDDTDPNDGDDDNDTGGSKQGERDDVVPPPPTIAQLYEECIVAGRTNATDQANASRDDMETMNRLHRSLAAWGDDHSALRRFVWPRVCELVASSSSSSAYPPPASYGETATTPTEQTVELVRACHLVAAFVAWEHRLGGYGNDYDGLDFVIMPDHERAWRVCLEQVLLTCRNNHQGRGGGDNATRASSSTPSETNWEFWTMRVRFLSIALSAAMATSSSRSRDISEEEGQLQSSLSEYAFYYRSTGSRHELQKPLLEHLSGLHLWLHMPERRRELEVRRHAAGIARDWTAMLEQQQQRKSRREQDGGSGQSTAGETPFIIQLIDQILRLVEGDLLRLGKIRLSEREHSDDENDETEDDHRQTQDGTQTVPNGKLKMWAFLHAGLDLVSDLLLYPATRTHLVLYMDSIHFVVKCRMSLGRSAHSRADENVFLAQQLLESIEKVAATPQHSQRVIGEDEAQEVAATELSSVEVRSFYHSRATVLQKMCHRHYADQLPDVVYTGVGLLCAPGNAFLRRALQGFDDRLLLELLHKMRLVDQTKEGGQGVYSRQFLLQVLEDYLTVPADPLEELQTLALYPTERVLWDFHRIPPSQSQLLQGQVLSLPKLPTQFLSFADYLWRNFELMRLESAYEIRSDLVDVIRRLRPVLRQVVNTHDDEGGGDDGGRFVDPDDATVLRTEFSGWARMALPLDASKGLELVKVKPPFLGRSVPSQVVADFTVDLSDLGVAIRREWDALSEYDNVFLVAVDAATMSGRPAPLLSEYHLQHGYHYAFDSDFGGGLRRSDRRIPDEDDRTFPQRYGITAVRGAMILHVRDEQGNVLNDPAAGQTVRGVPSVAPSSTGDHTTAAAVPVGTKRTFRVALDPSQYASDLDQSPTGSTDRLYRLFNLVVRREGRENNFKAVLETVRGLAEGTAAVDRILPPWMSRILLGRGDPAEACYRSQQMRKYAVRTAGVPHPGDPLDLGDTFLDERHLRDSFPGGGDDENAVTVIVDGRRSVDDAGADANACRDGGEQQASGDGQEALSSRRVNYRVRVVAGAPGGSAATTVEATSYPFSKINNARGNPVRFTTMQVEAIRSGLSPGLTLVVGPPGTGKTDTAVQIIACLYKTFTSQRTVIVTHSNAALNDIFLKVMERGDVDQRYLVRLGSGERDLHTTGDGASSPSSHDFTKAGRVAYSLHRRGELLEEVQRLSESLGISGKAERGKDGAPAYTCQTAAYFHGHQILKLVRGFRRGVAAMIRARRLRRDETTGAAAARHDEDCGDQDNLYKDMDVSSVFPFFEYFKIADGTGAGACADATCANAASDATLTLAKAEEHLAALDGIFSELAEYRPLELLRSHRQRSDYLIMKQARVVAMTCTHAAIARSHLLRLGFQYDNVIIEEAAQMTEIESFIPLLLQRGEGAAGDADAEPERSSLGLSRLKRVCLFGDHNQLPPVIKNRTFAKYSHLDQSLFTRFIRLGVPYIQLDRQGRARPEIARLYSWRYGERLGDLAHVRRSRPFLSANAGLAHTYQLINVEAFEGRGETTPTAYFYQNVGEAEYAVALFQYMVLIGHSPDSISILTTYNGQRALIRDILDRRCGPGTPLAGVRPRAVSTVDRYQGQQNDHVLLSLVRTENVGHIRDVRRLVVAVSRARLGLYVFCRNRLFSSCHELKPTWDQLRRRPDRLELVVGENAPTERRAGDAIPPQAAAPALFPVEDVTHLGSIVHQMQEEWIQQQQQQQPDEVGQQ